jgi:SulP family sulfate permease
VALLVVIAAAAAAELLGLDASRGVPIVADRAAVSSGWPPGALPSLDPALWRELLLPALAITLLGTLELAVSARAGGATPPMAREIAAQGWANVAGSLTSCIPASASLTRSALLRLGGSETRRAAALAAVFVLPILLFGGPAVGKIPQASLAGVLLVTASGMIDARRIRRMWVASRITRALLVITFVATLVLPIELAILIGAGLGLLIHLRETTRPRLTLLAPSGDGLVPLAEGRAEAVVLEVSGSLHYAAIGWFSDGAHRASQRATRLLVIDLSYAHGLRYAALLALERIAADRAARGAELVLAGVSPDFLSLLERTGSSLRAFAYDPRPGASVARALATARAGVA